MARGILDLPAELIEAVAEQLLGVGSILEEVGRERPPPKKEIPADQSYLQYQLNQNETLRQWHFSRQTFLQFRLVCRKIKSCTWRLFCHHYLSTLRVMVTEDAFQGLIDWSKDPVVSPEVRAISISMSTLAGVKNDPSLKWTFDVLQRRMKGNRPESLKHLDQLFKTYERRVIQHRCFLDSCLHGDMLAQALRGFENCQEISISDDRLFWTSHYPARKLMREDDVGVELMRPSGFGRRGPRVSDQFQMILAAVETSGALVETMRIDLARSTEKDYSLYPSAFSIPNSRKPVLANLRCLQVELDPRSTTALPREWAESFGGFLDSCVKLQELNLAFMPKRDCSAIMHELSTAKFTFPCLQTLQLREVKGCSYCLVAFIRRFKGTLRSLVLHNCRAKKCDCKSYKVSVEDPFGHSSLCNWHDIFSALQELMQDDMPLINVGFDHCRDDQDNTLDLWGYPERFDDDGKCVLRGATGGKKVLYGSGVVYKGEDVAEFLRALFTCPNG